jgi:hypothetical protein
MALIKIGTKIPPPVHAMIMLMNLYEKGALLLIVLNTLLPSKVGEESTGE